MGRKSKDLTGKRFGNLLVLGRDPLEKNGRLGWMVRCDCGTTKTLPSNNLTRQECGVKSCGCKRGRAHNLTGMRFNRLVALQRVSSNKAGLAYWLCRCDCGKEKIVQAHSLVGGNTGSCGCIQAVPPEVVAQNILIGRYRANARNKKRPFELALSEFLSIVTKHCEYCGDPPSAVIYQRNKNISPYPSTPFRYNGIDRKDNELGYTRENSIPCCGVCNRMKGIMPHEKFIAQLRKASHYQEKRLLNT